MSLQVWLPLNGDLNNLGLSSLTTIAVLSGVAIDNNGKIGKCYTNSSKSSAVNNTFNLTFSSFTLAGWVKINSSLTSWQRSFGIGGNDGLYLNLGCEHSNGTSLGFHCYKTINGTKTSIFDTYPVNKLPNTWVHYAMVYDGIKYYVYENGILKVSGNANRVNETFIATSFKIFGGVNGSYLLSSLNDIRFYDHALSAKEVKEISKGLVLHYRLAGPGQENLIINSVSNLSYHDYTSKATVSKLPSDGAVATNIYSITFPTDTNTYSNYNLYTYFSRDTSKAVQQDGKTYTISFKVKASKNLDNYTFMYEYINTSKAVNVTTQWQTVSMTGVANGTYSALYVCYGQANRAKINGGTLYIADLKLEEGSIATPWVPHSSDTLYSAMGFNNNIEYDCSGYRHNGTKSGNITWDIDSPRYTTSYKLNTGSDYIKSNFTTTMNELSISFWVKPSSSNGGYSIICSDYNNPTRGLWIATNCESCSVWAYRGAYMAVSGSLANDTWHHCVYTFKDGVSKWYINGEEKTLSRNTYTGTTLPITDLTIGNSYTGTSWNTKRYGNLSDFRIYATALPAEDIAELYHSAIIVDNTGKSYAYEYFEAN